MSSEQHRAGIFQYSDGEKLVWGDPLRIQRDLYTALGSPDEVLNDTESESPAIWMPAMSRLMNAARVAFPLAAFDPATGNGATDKIVQAAVDALWECLAEKKTTGESAGLPTSSEPTTSIPISSPQTSKSA
jgi:hypothetical protein